MIGSGIGGATLAAGLAGSGARVTILERGEQLPDSPAARDAQGDLRRPALPARGDCGATGRGPQFNPGNYYYVGGNSKFYGAVMLRYRERDFEELEHADGVSPAWPFPYAELEPWYGRAERLFQVRGAAGAGPDRARATRRPIRIAPVPDEPAIAAVRERLAAQGVHPFSLPLAIDIDRWLRPRRHALGRLSRHPQRQARRRDRTPGAGAAQPGRVAWSPARCVERLLLAPDGRRIEGVEYRQDGERRMLRAGTVVLSRRCRELGRAPAALGHDACPTASPTAPASSAATS